MVLCRKILHIYFGWLPWNFNLGLYIFISLASQLGSKPKGFDVQFFFFYRTVLRSLNFIFKSCF